MTKNRIQHSFSLFTTLMKLTAGFMAILAGSFISSVFSSCSESMAESVYQPRNLIRVPMTRQSTNYTCGVASAQSVFGYYGLEYREDNLARELGTDPDTGTNYRNIVTFAQSKGFTAEAHTDMNLDQLKDTIDAGHPVILAIQAWSDTPDNYTEDWDDGHYVVAIGHDDNNVYFMDPSTLGNYTYIPVDEFLTRWHDFDSHENKPLVHFGIVIYKDHPVYNREVIKKLE